MVSKMLNMFQVGLMGQMGSGSEGIQKCFGITRNVTQHTHTHVKEMRAITTRLQINKLLLFLIQPALLLLCWAAARRHASPVLAQPRD